MLPLGSAAGSSPALSPPVVSVVAPVVSVASPPVVSVGWSPCWSPARVVAVPAASEDSWAPAAAPAPARAAATSTASTPETHGARQPERRGGRNEDTMAPSLSGVVEGYGDAGGVAGRGLGDRQPALHLLLVVLAVEPVATRLGCRETDQGARVGGQVLGDLQVAEGEVVLGGVGVGDGKDDLGPGGGRVGGRCPGRVGALQLLLGAAVQLHRNRLGGLAGGLVGGTVSSADLGGRDGAAGDGQRHHDQARDGQEQTASRHRGPSLVREFPLPPGNSPLSHRIP